ncbi:MAG TPA: hypothetical protein VGK92_00740 [Gaiellales bacterium]
MTAGLVIALILHAVLIDHAGVWSRAVFAVLGVVAGGVSARVLAGGA